MSTISHSFTHVRPAARPARPARPAPRRVAAPARVRLTRRGRLLVVLALALVTSLLATALMTAFSGLAAATFDRGSAPAVHYVQVRPGDTLYGFADRLARPGHVQETVARIEELNSLPGPELPVGRRLALPGR